MLKRRPKLRAEIIKTGAEQRSVCVRTRGGGKEGGGRGKRKGKVK